MIGNTPRSCKGGTLGRKEIIATISNFHLDCGQLSVAAGFTSTQHLRVTTLLSGCTPTAARTLVPSIRLDSLFPFFFRAIVRIDVYPRRPMPHVTIRIAGEFGADRDKACASEVSSRVFRSSSVPHVQPRLCIARRDIHKWHAHARAALRPPWTIRSCCNSGEFAQLHSYIFVPRVDRWARARARWPICSYITGSNTRS